MGVWRWSTLALPCSPVVHVTPGKCGWEEAIGGQVLGQSPSSTASGEGGLQWSDLDKRSVIGSKTDSQDSEDHGIHPWTLSVSLKKTKTLRLVFCRMSCMIVGFLGNSDAKKFVGKGCWSAVAYCHGVLRCLYK